jgi:hypothetical protein
LPKHEHFLLWHFDGALEQLASFRRCAIGLPEIGLLLFDS